MRPFATFDIQSDTDIPVIDRPMVTGPIDVPLGRRVVTDKHDYYPFPRQKFPIDREKLKRNGYGDAVISHLENGHWITMGDYALTGPGFGVLEFPDGRRYSTRLQHLGGEKVAIEIVRRLPDAIR